MKELDSFTVEEIEEIISSCRQEIHNTPTSDEFPVSPRLLLSLARIALAAKRAEPVAWVVGDEEITDFKNGREVCVMRDCDDEQLDYLPLYTTPQLNSPQGWIKCSDQMPEVGDVVITAYQGCTNVGQMERSGKTYRYFTSIASGRELPATHWMTLPAAPEKENG
ncbi:DUF551 domain-containing protein [Yersinia enterocolitica]|nr:DUF551 domain-containing protein [Yersinia enterocolitica]